MRNRVALLALAAVLAVLVLGGFWWWHAARSGPLVVYCPRIAGDAEKILRVFEQRSGIPLEIHFDTAALLREKDAPRCDVFWSDELSGMLDLQGRGRLQSYQGPGYARIPAAFKAPDGSWTGFAARLRVVIYNTAKIGTTPPNLVSLLPGSDLSRIALARPLSGSTLLHYTLLWRLWGGDKIKAWHSDWRIGGVKELDDNGAVRDAVADGVCYAGFTDTDDFFAAKEDQRPVAMSPVRLEDGKTICVPNTVAILRGARRTGAARQLVDFLLSEETELALAASPSRQIPLGPVPAERLPAEVRDLVQPAREGENLTALGTASAECQAWLKSQAAP